MEPSPDNARQSRGLARFWPVHGMPAPAQRDSDEDAAEAVTQSGPQPEADPGAPDSQSASTPAADADQPATGVPSEPVRPAARATGSPVAPGRPGPISESQMVVALGSRRGWNGNQVDFPSLDAELGPRHGGAPVARNPQSPSPFAQPPFAQPPFAQPPFAVEPARRSPFEPPAFGPAAAGATAAPGDGKPGRFVPASPFAPPGREDGDESARVIALGAAASSDDKAEASRGIAAAPGAGRRWSAEEDDRAGLDERARPGGRAESGEQARPATGWAAAPTSGMPALPIPPPIPPPTPEGAAGAGAAGLNGAGARPQAESDHPQGGTLGRRRAEDDDLRAPDGRADESSPDESNGTVRAAEPASRRLVNLADADAALPRAGLPAADTAEAPLRPGDVNLIPIVFWDEEAIVHFRTQWHEVKAAFVDDPVAALNRAHDLLTDAVNELTETLLAERDELDPLRTTSAPDTENMRMAMRGYREFLDRILAL